MAGSNNFWYQHFDHKLPIILTHTHTHTPSFSIYVYIHISAYIHLYVYFHIYVCVYIYVCLHIYMYICICIYMCVCMYVCIWDRVSCVPGWHWVCCTAKDDFELFIPRPPPSKELQVCSTKSCLYGSGQRTQSFAPTGQALCQPNYILSPQTSLFLKLQFLFKLHLKTNTERHPQNYPANMIGGGGWSQLPHEYSVVCGHHIGWTDTNK